MSDATRTAVPAAPPRTARRADLEGLRIVAVVLVVVYHYAQAGVSGGVDVFLFLSGFFVLGGLARRLSRDEPARLGDFYRRTARRLLPLTWLAATTTVLAAVLVASRGDLVGFVEQYVAGMLSVENVWLARHQVAYGAASTYLDPFQHLWSLSVQVQVFLAVPLLLVATAWVARRARGRTGSLLVPVAVVAVLTTGLGWWLTARDQASAYFATPARVWEFVAGALLALLLPSLRLPAALRAVLGWVGLVALASTGLLVDGASVFPGPWALLPLLAASAVVVAGTGGPTRWGVDRLLAQPVLARAGGYAFALYLWHWPVMSVWLLATGEPRLGPLGLVVALVVTLGLTVASHHLVEAPLRAPRAVRAPWSRWVAGGVATAVVATSAWSVVLYREDRRWIDEVTELAAAADLSTHPGVMSVYRPDLYPAPDDMLAIPLPSAGVVDDGDGTVASCDVVGHEPGQWCMWNLEPAQADDVIEVVLLGGSHSGAWLQPTQVLGQEFGWHVSGVIRGGCPFLLSDVLDVADYYDPVGNDGCNAWNQKLYEHLADHPPDLVVTTFSRPFGPDGEPEWVPQQYVDVWEALDELGIEVLAIRSNALLPPVDQVCPDDSPCSFPREEIYGDDETVLGTSVPGNVHVIDLTQYACEDGTCPSEIGNVRVYADRTHLTNSYGFSAWPVLYDFVLAELPALTG